MRTLTSVELEAFFRSLEPDYDLRVPIALRDGTRTLGRMGEGALALEGGPLLLKPTSVFFPQYEMQLGYEGGVVRMQAPLPKPLCVVGLSAQDADCLSFIDEFFRSNYEDDLYFNKRNGAVIVVVSGRCGQDGEFLKIANGKCDIELICHGTGFFMVPYTPTGRRLCSETDLGREAADSLDLLKEESSALSTEEEEILQRASRLLLEDKVPESFWTEISKRCIACTACNLFCPTCTCFEVYDRRLQMKIERQRLWDSCQLDGFTREASGHNPMGSETLRTRRRIHHKLGADVVRWGRISCFLCGRCDRVCPTGIGIKAVSREMVQRYDGR